MSDPTVFDLSGIDWDDDESIHGATRRVWEIAATRMGATLLGNHQERQPAVILTDRFTEARLGEIKARFGSRIESIVRA